MTWDELVQAPTLDSILFWIGEHTANRVVLEEVKQTWDQFCQALDEEEGSYGQDWIVTLEEGTLVGPAPNQLEPIKLYAKSVFVKLRSGAIYRLIFVMEDEDTELIVRSLFKQEIPPTQIN